MGVLQEEGKERTRRGQKFLWFSRAVKGLPKAGVLLETLAFLPLLPPFSNAHWVPAVYE